MQCTLFRPSSVTYDVDEHIQRTLPLLNKLGSVVLCPLLLLVLAEISRKGFLAPVAVAGIGNWSEGGDRLVLARVLEELCVCVSFSSTDWRRERVYQSQGTMTTHAVTSDADSVRVQLLEGGEESFGKILGDVRVHVVALVVGLLCGIDVEAGA